MLEKLKKIESVVFVGGFALFKQGLVSKYSDIDIVTTDRNFYPGVQWYETDSAFSKSGQRGFLIEDGLKLDIFLEEKLPDFLEVGGFRVQTIKSMRDYYENIYIFVKDYWKPSIEEKLKLLS